MRLITKPAVLFLTALVGAGLQGCVSSSSIDSDISGRTLVYSPGVPNFDMEAIATLDGDDTGIDLYIGIPYASLIFHQVGNEYVAHYEASIELRDADDEETFDEIVWSDTVRIREYRLTVKSNLPSRWFDEHPHTHVALDDAIEQGALFCNMLEENTHLASSERRDG